MPRSRSFLLARALRAQGRYDEALEALDAAEKAGYSATTLAAERIFTLGMGDRVEEGIALAREALARDPDAAALHAAHAALLFAAGAAEPGALATDRALALEPGEPRPLRVRCEFHASIRQWPAARDDCTRYLAARPDDAGAHFMLGVIEQSHGDRARQPRRIVAPPRWTNTMPAPSTTSRGCSRPRVISMERSQRHKRRTVSTRRTPT